MEVIRVLFICLGNICRSPSAEGVFRRMLEDADLAELILADSAGTGNWHVGKSPDHRAQVTALRRGLDISALRARQIVQEDFSTFDYIVAMDQENMKDLDKYRPPTHQPIMRLLLDFGKNMTGRDVPDPYYGPQEDFERMFDLIENGAADLLRHIKTTSA